MGPVGEHVVVLEQQQMLLRSPTDCGVEERLLDGERFAVRHAAEPSDAERRDAHVDPAMSELRAPVARLEDLAEAIQAASPQRSDTTEWPSQPNRDLAVAGLGGVEEQR